MNKLVAALFALGLVPFGAALLAQTGFNVDQLPGGKSVMLPHSTPPLIPMGRDVSVASTENAQTVMFSAVYTGPAPAPVIDLTIHDPAAPQPLHVAVKSGAPVLYAYKKMGPIRLQPALKGDKRRAGLMLLKVESAAPLDVMR